MRNFLKGYLNIAAILLGLISVLVTILVIISISLAPLLLAIILSNVLNNNLFWLLAIGEIFTLPILIVFINFLGQQE